MIAATNQAINMSMLEQIKLLTLVLLNTLRNAILMDGDNADNNTINNSGTIKGGKKQVYLELREYNNYKFRNIETTNSSNPNTGGINYYNTSGICH